MSWSLLYDLLLEKSTTKRSKWSLSGISRQWREYVRHAQWRWRRRRCRRLWWSQRRSTSRGNNSALNQQPHTISARQLWHHINLGYIIVWLTGLVVNGGDTQSRNLRKKLAQVPCASFLHQIFVQVHASSCTRNFHNKYGRQSWYRCCGSCCSSYCSFSTRKTEK